MRNDLSMPGFETRVAMRFGASILVRFPLAALIAALSASLLIPTLSQAGGAGKLEVATKSFDAGRVALGEEVEHVFVLSNRGAAAVRILEIQTSCGCTASEYRETIPSGESAPLRLTIDTSELEPGTQSKTATVRSDAADGGRVVLQIKLDVYPPLEILPRPVLFLEAEPGRASSRKLIARAHRPGLEIVSESSDNEMIEVVVSGAGSGAAERDASIEITLVGAAPAGVHKARVSLRTNDPAYPESLIRVSAIVSD